MFQGLFKKNIFLAAIYLFFAQLAGQNFTVLSGLKGTCKNLPIELRKYSPIHGVLLVHSGELHKIYKEEGPLGQIARLLFYQLDGSLVPTARPSNPFFMVPDRLIADIILALDSKEIFNAFIKNSELFKQPFEEIYVKDGAQTKKNFRTVINRFFRYLIILQSSDDLSIRAKLRKLFLSFIYLRAKTDQDLKRFLLLLTPPYLKIQKSLDLKNVFTKQDLELFTKQIGSFSSLEDEIEKVIKFLVLNQKSPFEFLIPKNRHCMYNQNSVAICAEDVFQGVMNFIFYDYQKQKFTIQRVAKKLHLNKKYKEFIEYYNDPHIDNYMERTKDDWMDLLSNVPSVEYLSDDKYEIKPDKNNFLKIFSFLIGQKVNSFSELGRFLSTEERTVVFTPQVGLDSYGEIVLDITDSNGFKILLNIIIEGGHAYMLLKDQEKVDIPFSFFKEIRKLTEASNLPLSSLINVNEVFVDDNENTLLIKSVIKKDLEIIYFLLKTGVDIDKKNLKGNTAFAVACQRNNFEIMDLLRRHGANLDTENNEGETPFKTAMRKTNIDVIKYLIKYGVSIDQKSAFKEQFIISLFSKKQYRLAYLLLHSKPVNSSYISSKGLSLFIEAIKSNHYNSIEKLIQRGADINKKEKETKLTPLMIAIKKQNFKVVDLLLRSGIKEEILNPTSLLAPISPLLVSVRERNYLITETLLLHEVDPNFEGEEGFTPLLAAIKNKDLSLVKLLIRNGADLNYRTLLDDLHPLELAFKVGDVAIIKELISSGVIFDFELKKFIEENKKEIFERYGVSLRNTQSPNPGQMALDPS